MTTTWLPGFLLLYFDIISGSTLYHDHGKFPLPWLDRITLRRKIDQPRFAVKKSSPKDQRMDVLDTYLEHGFGTRVNDALTGSLDFVEKAHGGFGLFGWEIDGTDEEDAKGKSRLCYYLFDRIQNKQRGAPKRPPHREICFWVAHNSPGSSRVTNVEHHASHGTWHWRESFRFALLTVESIFSRVQSINRFILQTEPWQTFPLFSGRLL